MSNVLNQVQQFVLAAWCMDRREFLESGNHTYTGLTVEAAQACGFPVTWRNLKSACRAAGVKLKVKPERRPKPSNGNNADQDALTVAYQRGYADCRATMLKLVESMRTNGTKTDDSATVRRAMKLWRLYEQIWSDTARPAAIRAGKKLYSGDTLAAAVDKMPEPEAKR